MGGHGNLGEMKAETFEISSLKGHMWKEMGCLQGLLLLLFLIALVLGLFGAFLKMLGTYAKLADYPHSQPLQQV